MYKYVYENVKCGLLGKVLEKLNKYGMSPWTIERELDGMVCTKTLYNYMYGETKPNPKLCSSLLASLKSHYGRLYEMIIDEIYEDYGNMQVRTILDSIVK